MVEDIVKICETLGDPHMSSHGDYSADTDDDVT